ATSVPGCLTKGDLDMVVRVDQADFAAAESFLSTLLARNTGSARTGGFASFKAKEGMPSLGVQLTVRGGELDVFHIFAEALRADAALLRRYNRLKLAFHNKPMS